MSKRKIVFVLMTYLLSMFSVYSQKNAYDWSETYSIYVQEADSIKNIYGEQSKEYCDALNNLVCAYVYFGAKYENALSIALNLNDITKRIYGEYSKNYSETLATTCTIYNLLGKYDNTISVSKEYIFWAPKDSVTSSLLLKYIEALGQNNYNYKEALSVSRYAISRLHNISDSVLYTSKISQLYMEHESNTYAAKNEIEKVSNIVENASDYSKYQYFRTLGFVYSDIDEERSYLYFCKADSLIEIPTEKISILQQKAKVAPSHIISEECLLNALTLQAYYLGEDLRIAADVYAELGQLYERIGKCLHAYCFFNKAVEITNSNNNILVSKTAVTVWGKFAKFLRSKNTLLHIEREKHDLSTENNIQLAKLYDRFACAISMDVYGPSHPVSELQHIRLAQDYLLMNKLDSALFELPKRISDAKPSDYIIGYESYIMGACAFKQNNFHAADSLLMQSVSKNDEKRKDAYKLLIESKYKQSHKIDAYNLCGEYHRIIIDEYLRKLLILTEEERNNYIFLLENDANSLSPYICDKTSIEQSLRLSLFCKGLLFSTTSSIRKQIFQNENSYKLFKILQKKKQELYEFQIEESSIDRRLKQSIDALELNLSKEFIKIDSIRNEIDVPISKLQLSLKKNDLAIDFEQISENIYLMYLLTDKEISFETIQIPSTVESNEICSFILDKLEAYLRNCKRVYFSPIGQLNLLNFESYARGKKKNIEFHRISHLHRLLSDKNYHLKEIVAMGNPRFNDELVISTERGIAFGPLPGTQMEIESISKALGKKNVTTHLFTEDAANENNLKKFNGSLVNVLHIATHGYYLSEKKETGLLLTGANRGLNESKISNFYEDGILMTSEIERMFFPQLQLVVLSACDSGLGETNIDGVWGLQRAFRVAGAQNLIVSLKKVDDEGTLSFMTSFYKKLSQTNNIYKSFIYAQDNADEDTRNSFILVE